MEYLELIKTRQSCRKYDKDKSVSRGEIEACLNFAMLAPSACNAQPWKFTVATGGMAEKIAKLTMGMGMNKFAVDAPVMIVVSEGEYNKTALVGSKIKDQDYRSVDIGLAVSQLCCGATSMGLSTCILGWFDENKIKEELKIKSRIRLVVCLGYADSADKIREKSRKEFDKVVNFVE